METAVRRWDAGSESHVESTTRTSVPVAKPPESRQWPAPSPSPRPCPAGRSTRVYLARLCAYRYAAARERERVIARGSPLNRPLYTYPLSKDPGIVESYLTFRGAPGGFFLTHPACMLVARARREFERELLLRRG